MTQPSLPGSWLALRRELFATALDPWTLRERGPHLLPIGALIEAAPLALQFAQTMNLVSVAIRVQLVDSIRVCVERVDVAELRDALGL